MTPPPSDTQLALLEALFQEGMKAANDQDWGELPYLVYADWLEETGDEATLPCARFIRLLCATDRNGNWADDQKEYGAEARRLLHEYRARWFGSHEPFFPKRVSSYGCGFIDEMTFRASTAVNRPAFDWLTEPNVGVDVYGRGRSLIDYLRHKLIGLRDLTVIPTIPLADAATAARLMDAAATAVAENPGATDLRSLRLLYLSDEGIHSLAKSPHLQRIQALMLEGIEVSAEAFGALAESPVTEKLSRFMVSYWFGTDDPWRALEPLFVNPRLSQLTALRLDEVNPGRAGMNLLLNAPHLAGLHTLYITDAGLMDDDCDPLFEAGGRSALKALMLNGNYLTDRTLRRFAASPWMARLHELELEGNRLINADAAVELLRSPHLGALKSFSLSVKSGGLKLVRELVQCEKLSGLKQLSLSRSRLTDRAIDVLLTAPWIDQLEYLNLGGSNLSAETARRIRRRLPGPYRVKA